MILCGLFLIPILSRAQDENEPGHAIGKVSTEEDLIVMELDAGALGKTNPFDLTGRTLRFTPDGSRYRLETQALEWDTDFGPELGLPKWLSTNSSFLSLANTGNHSAWAQRARYALANRLMTVLIHTATAI